MKQLLFMIAVTGGGALAGLFVEPFYGLAVYYLFAVLRPQYMWVWALPPDIAWSEYVAVATLVGIAIRGFGISMLQNGRRGRRVTGIHLTLLMFGLWVALTCLTAQYASVARIWFWEYLKIFLMLFAAVVAVRTLRQVWILLVLASVAIGYIGYEVNFGYLVNHRLWIYHNGFGGLDNNGAGLMLAMGIPLNLFLWTGIRRPVRWVFLAFVPVLLHAVLMTYSRGAMVALLVASPLMFVRGKHRLQLGAATLGLALLVPVFAGREIRDRFFTLREYRDESSARLRFASWQAAWRIALDYPILGVGVRNSDRFSFRYGADSEGRAIHSQFLQTLADTGFPGLILYLAVLTLVARALTRCRRWARSDTSDEADRAYTIACAVESALAVFCVGALFLSLDVFELPYLLILIGAQLPVVLGLAGVSPESRHSDVGVVTLAGGPRATAAH